MKTLVFYGSSDDLFIEEHMMEVCNDGTDTPIIIELYSKSQESGINVCATYTRKGTWNIGIGLIDEDEPIDPLHWRYEFDINNSYNNKLTVDCPDDTTITVIKGQE